MGSSTGLSDVGGQRLVTPIRGRADELKVIGALVAAVAKGRGGVLVIEGPPGIGKSRMVTEALGLADKGGVRTLFGEAFEYQQTLPFFSLFMATLRADPPIGNADALRRLHTAVIKAVRRAPMTNHGGWSSGPRRSTAQGRLCTPRSHARPRLSHPGSGLNGSVSCATSLGAGPPRTG